MRKIREAKSKQGARRMRAAEQKEAMNLKQEKKAAELLSDFNQMLLFIESNLFGSDFRHIGLVASSFTVTWC